MTQPEKYIHRCIQLAKLGQGQTQQNPMVGAVLVYKDRIIGEGYHKKYGEAHAEVNCINSVHVANKKLIPAATLYVNLEPCNHTGKTPPCTDAILNAGIQKVVVGTTDENPIVTGKGIARLKENNVEVIMGILQNDCYKINKVFFTNQKFGRAFIKLKWAETANGCIGEKNNQIAISTERTNIISHKHRSKIDAVLVGYNTALNDAPQLNVRHWLGPQPARIFVDWECALPQEILHKKGHRNIVLNSKKNAVENSIEYITVEKNALAIAEKLLAQNICSVLVEGGAKTHELFLSANIWDEAVVITGRVVIPDGIPAAKIIQGKLINRKNIDTDTISHFSNTNFLQ